MEVVKVVWITLQILGVLNWGPDHKNAGQYVFQKQDEMAKVWVADGGKKDELPVRYDEVGEMRVFDEKKGEKAPPKVDFDKHTVLAVFAGEKPSGGHEIKIEKVLESEDQKKVVVLVRQNAPAKDAMLTQVLTYPRQVVVVKKLTGKVVFVQADSDEGKMLVEELKGK